MDLPRRAGAISVLGGPTTVVDIAGRRIVMDPTFDPPGEHAYLTKTAGPAMTADALGPVDAVLISHDEHPDNLDDEGRRWALAAPLVLTHPGGAGRLGPPAVGLAPWESYELPGGSVTLVAQVVPAVHGPADGQRDAGGSRQLRGDGLCAVRSRPTHGLSQWRQCLDRRRSTRWRSGSAPSTSRCCSPARRAWRPRNAADR